MINDIIDLIKSGKIQIKEGFTFKGPLPPGSNKEHYCIIVNKRVTKKSTILYFFMTSQTEKAIKFSMYDKKALVFIDKKDYSLLTKQTVIQCSKSHLHSIEYKTLLKGLSSGHFSDEKDISKTILYKIIKAVSEGKTFTYEEKKDFPLNMDPFEF